MTIEIWGGVECTVNRVGSRYFNQLLRSGHADRLSDLDLFRDLLGLDALRTPLLWENVAPDPSISVDRWRWPDAYLERIPALGMRPIVGLLHHGSGPEHTSLIDPEFPKKFAEYALRCAQRYPWVREWTPINEPLTTARFCTLYGFWYPHLADEAAFARCVLYQCQAIALAMDAIRSVQPEAKLVLTEDLGVISSAKSLRALAQQETERRWLSMDLLMGRVDSSHPFYDRLAPHVGDASLEAFASKPCVPDVIGINYYITSDRYLEKTGGRPDQHRDIEAVRVAEQGLAGHQTALARAWERYQRPVALTEVHLDCTREEQMRWFLQAWEAAERLRQKGADVRAITAWSLLGSFDWNILVMKETGYYEPGVFDIRAPKPRATALAQVIRDLKFKGRSDHPLLAQPGWWYRRKPTKRTGRPMVQPLLITGGGGRLAQAFARACELRAIPHQLILRQELDIADLPKVVEMLEDLRPWSVINAAGYIRIDRAETEKDACYRVNTIGPELLASECAQRGVRFLTFSTDLVFDGAGQRPYVENDHVAPLSVYGASKAEGERRVLGAHERALVVRTSGLFGPWDENNFVTRTLRQWQKGVPVHAARGIVSSPTYVPDLVRISLDLLIDEERGVWHLANVGAVSWADLATTLAAMTGTPAFLVEPTELEDLNFLAPRPKYSVLGSDRGALMPLLEGALERYLSDVEPLFGSCIVR